MDCGKSGNPSCPSVSPASGVAGTSVTITGSGFGAAQGTGQVWLGTLNGVVQSWSDTQVVALVAAGSASANAQVLQNGVISNAIPFTVNTHSANQHQPILGKRGDGGHIYRLRLRGFSGQRYRLAGQHGGSSCQLERYAGCGDGRSGRGHRHCASATERRVEQCLWLHCAVVRWRRQRDHAVAQFDQYGSGRYTYDSGVECGGTAGNRVDVDDERLDGGEPFD